MPHPPQGSAPQRYRDSPATGHPARGARPSSKYAVEMTPTQYRMLSFQDAALR